MTWIDVSSSELTTAILGMFLVAMILAARGLALKTVRSSRAERNVQRARERLAVKLSSKGLATLIVDSLVESKILAPEKTKEALEVAARKIDLRKALGDY